MAQIANTMFEITVSNSVNNQLQNVPGLFGTGTGASFEGDICPAGFLCVPNGLTSSEGYGEKLNGNTWYFNAATDGKAGMLGDHTGIYAFNAYNVNRAVSGTNAWNVGANTLGLQLPADERGDFCEIIVGEQYTFGAGNFSTLPSDTTYKYATVANGLLVASTTAPAAGSGVYFNILRTKPMNEGTSFWGTGYVLQAVRAAAN